MSKKVITYYPHHAMMTECDQNFLNFSEGFAEFFDNSLQACHNNSLSECEDYYPYINLTFYLSHRLQAGYAVICDNGCGMDCEDIKNFASFALNEDKRKIAAAAKEKLKQSSSSVISANNHNGSNSNHYFETSDSTSHISKYGVGAKQAAFYLGTRVRIISRKLFSNAPNDEIVNEFYMSKDEADDNFNRTGDTKASYEGPILSRRLNDFNILESKFSEFRDPQEKEFQKMIEDIQSHEKSNSGHFNIMIIKLKQTVCRKLFEEQEYENLINNLSCFYIFYLHPNYKFEKLINNKEKGIIKSSCLSNKRKNGHICTTTPNKSSSSSSSFKKPRNDEVKSIHDGDHDDSITVLELPTTHNNPNVANLKFEKSLEMQLRMVIDDISDDDRDVNLGGNRNVGNYYKNCIEVAKSECGFAFIFRIDDPNGIKHNVSCLLFYYPYEEGHGTKPTNTATILSDNIGSSSQTQTAQRNTVSSSSADIHDEEEPLEDIFSVFWVDRELSQTKVKFLDALYPKSFNEKYKNNISAKWKHRLKGFMFLDRSFEYISNNKLKVSVDGGFESYLNDKKRNKVQIDKGVKDEFFKWLVQMKEKFDQDYRLLGRDEQPFDKSNIARNKSYFRNLFIGTHKVEKGKTYKFDLSKKGKLNSPRTSNSEVYGTIVSFEVNEGLSSVTQESLLPCVIYYYREPQNRYGFENLQKCYPSDLVIVNKQSVVINQIQLTELSKSMPASVEVSFFHNADLKSNEFEILSDQPFNVNKGVLFKLGIQIRNSKNDAICFMPQTECKEAKRMHIEARWKLADGTCCPFDKANGSNFEEFDAAANSFVKATVRNNGQQDLSQAFYMFYKVSLIKSGKFELQLQITDPTINRIVFPFSGRSASINPPADELWHTACTFDVPHERVTLDLDWCDREQQENNEETMIRSIRLNKWIPGFKITMRNGDGHLVNSINGNIWIDFLISTSKYKQVLHIVMVDAEGNVDNSDPVFTKGNGSSMTLDKTWQVMMKDPTKYLEQFMKSICTAIDLNCTLQLFQVAENTNTKSDVALCEKCKIDLKLFPGSPANIDKSPENSAISEYVNGDIIKKIKFTVHDNSRHKTFPIVDINEEWYLVFDPKGPIQCFEPQKIGEDGTCTLKDFLVEVQSCPPGGSDYDQHICLDTGICTKNGNALRSEYNLNDLEQLNNYFNKLKNSRKCVKESLPFRMKNNMGTMTVKLSTSYGLIDDDETITKIVAEKIEEITFILYDENGHPVVIDLAWFSDASCGYKASWSTPNSKKKNSKTSKVVGNGSLPNIILSDKAETTEYSLDLLLINDMNITFSFTVITIPDLPKAWIIDLAPETIENGIMISSNEDVFRKIKSVKAIDQFKNKIDLSLYPTVTPLLEIHFKNPDLNEEDNENENNGASDYVNDTITLNLEYSTELKRYFVNINQTWQVSRKTLNHDTSSTSPENNFIWIRAISNSNETIPNKRHSKSNSSSTSNSIKSLTPDVRKCLIVAGWPQQLEIISWSENLVDFSVSRNTVTDNQPAYSLTANRFSKGFLYVTVYDALNQIPSLDMIKNIKFTLTDENDIKIQDITLPKGTKSLQKIPIGIDFCWDPKQRTILLSMSYCQKTQKGESSNNQIYELEPTRLICTLLPTNCVRLIKFQNSESDGVIELNHMDIESKMTNTIIIKAGDPMPTLRVYLTTDDKKPLSVLSIENFNIKISRKRTGNMDDTKLKLLAYEDYFTLNCSSNTTSSANALSYIELIPITGNIEEKKERKNFGLQASLINIEITYIENREDYKHIVAKDLTKDQIIINLIPDKPYGLAIDSKSNERLDNLTVSGSLMSNPALRIIGEDIKVFIVDQYGNILSAADLNNEYFQESSLVCFISSSPSSVTYQEPSIDNIPRLEDSERPSDEEVLKALRNVSCGQYTNNYILKGEFKPLQKDITGFLFKSLHIRPNPDNHPNEYNLVFMLLPQSNHLVPASSSSRVVTFLKPLIKPFQFHMDEERVNQVHDINNSLKMLKPKILNLKEELDAMNNDITNKERKRDKMLRGTSYEGRRISDTNTQVLTLSGTTDGNGAEIDRLLNYKARQDRNLKDVQRALRSSQQTVRPAVIPSNASTIKSDLPFQIVGRVIDIGFVDDLIDAKIMSNVAAGYMNGYITNKIDEKNYLYKNLKLDVLSLEDLATSIYTGQPRNNEEMKSQKLPGLKSLQHLQGNPTYMVNTIELLKENESLRKSVFWNIFRDGIIFDTLEHATVYRKQLLSEAKPVPKMYTRLGDVIPSNGFLRHGTSNRIDNVTYIFGQKPSENAAEEKKLLTEIGILDEVIEIANDIRSQMADKDAKRRELDQLESEYKSYKSQLKVLTDEGYRLSQIP